MSESEEALERDEVVVVETNLDDATGELLGWLMDRLLAAGALDVSYMPMQMKKNRPATLVRVIARPGDAEALAALIVRETPTLGVRLMPMQRLIAARRSEMVESPLGVVTVKLKLLAGTVVSVSPEYDDCRRLASETGLPLGEVMSRLDTWLGERYQL
jgi:pyridinium-3,5-bisthiocarboxylic acid mononucleotide nickel chelatase